MPRSSVLLSVLLAASLPGALASFRPPPPSASPPTPHSAPQLGRALLNPIPAARALAVRGDAGRRPAGGVVRGGDALCAARRAAPARDLWAVWGREGHAHRAAPQGVPGTRGVLRLAHHARPEARGGARGALLVHGRGDDAEGGGVGAFAESNEVHGNLYGTSFAALQRVCDSGRVPVLDLDVQGAEDLRRHGVTGFFVFIAPPSMQALEARLRGRKTESEDRVLARLAGAAAEIEASKQPGLFDCAITNTDLAVSYETLKGRLPWSQLRATTTGSATKGFTSETLASKGEKLSKPQVVFVLGGPGSGKGTQCAKLVAMYDTVHLSAGDLLREEKASASKEADLINACIQDGKIVPVEITCRLIEKAMLVNLPPRDSSAPPTVFLIDGFPRNLDNLQGWTKVLRERVDVRFVLFFNCSEPVMRERLLERGKTSGRTDDNVASIKKRFVTFEQETMPVVRDFKERGLVRSVDAHKDVESVFVDVQTIFEEFL
eukprot:CAMPEP_0180415366 /NCGR_PEP_ID=MMETSP0989-20121125/46164_1 /TAXON_ID=697907 /ORGANISM="non described non described, Strain CCMP2293" /LENGTH=490 /DNA_ID=CAMNT_0022420151 /DNA_START=35 /DNA_END=1505 /DNA_ORIENTATION=-